VSSISLQSGAAADGSCTIAHSMSRHRRRVLALLIASAMVTPAFGKGSSTPGHRHVRSGSSEAKHHPNGTPHRSEQSERAVRSRILPERESAQDSAQASEVSPDLKATRHAIALVRHRKFSEAAALAATIDDPIARKLIEWVTLRDSDSPAGFDRYAAFIQANADWPSIPLLRRRAEARLWQERREVSTVRRFLGRPIETVPPPAQSRKRS
jgi:soluble lytic murein transglycosylase